MGAPTHTVNGDGSSRPNHKWERELPANIHLRVGAPSQYMGSVRELPAMWCGSTHAVVHGYIGVQWGLPPRLAGSSRQCQWKLPYKVYGSSRWCVKMSGGSIQGIGWELPQVGWELPQVGWELPQ
ncbi:hypothetical protein B0H17DRAFT_1144542, partial [Mycena rosella]